MLGEFIIFQMIVARKKRGKKKTLSWSVFFYQAIFIKSPNEDDFD